MSIQPSTQPTVPPAQQAPPGAQGTQPPPPDDPLAGELARRLFPSQIPTTPDQDHPLANELVDRLTAKGIQLVGQPVSPIGESPPPPAPEAGFDLPEFLDVSDEIRRSLGVEPQQVESVGQEPQEADPLVPAAQIEAQLKREHERYYDQDYRRRSFLVRNVIPWVRDAAAIKDDIRVFVAAKRITNDEGRESDIRVVAQYLAEQKRMGEQSVWARIGETAASIPGYALEIGLTTPVYAIGKKGAKRLTARLLRKQIDSKIAKLLTATLPRVAGLGVMAGANPQMVGATVTRMAAQTLRLSSEETGQFQLFIDEDDEGFVGQLPEAYLDVMLQLGSEFGGKHFASMGRAALGKALKGRVAANWLSRSSGIAPRTPGLLLGLARKGQWHGIWNEYLEERAYEVAALMAPGIEADGVIPYFGEGLNALARGDTSEASRFAKEVVRQSFVEVAAFGIVGAGLHAPGYVQNALTAGREAPERADLLIPRTPYAPDFFDTLENTQYTAARYPEAVAAALAPAKPASRRNAAMKLLVEFPEGEGGNEAARQKVVDALSAAQKEAPDASETAPKPEETGPQEGAERGAGEEVRVRDAGKGQEGQPGEEDVVSPDGESQTEPQVDPMAQAAEEWDERAVGELGFEAAAVEYEELSGYDQAAERDWDTLADQLEMEAQYGGEEAAPPAEPPVGAPEGRVSPIGETAETPPGAPPAALAAAKPNPEVQSLFDRVVRRLVEKGQTNFGVVTKMIARRIGPGATTKIGPAIVNAWDKVKAEQPDAGLTETTPLVEDSVKGMKEVKPKGRPDLAVPGRGRTVERTFNTTNELRNIAGIPAQKSDRTTAEASLRAIAKAKADPDAVLQRLEDRVRDLDEDVLAAKAIVEQEMLKGAASRGDYRKAIPLVDRYVDTGTHQSRSFRQRGRQTLWEILLTPPNWMRKKMKRFRKTNRPEKVQEYIEKWNERVKEILAELQESGIDLTKQIDKFAENPWQMAAVSRAIQSRKSTKTDWAYELWINNLLSGIPTQVVNFGSNTLHMSHSMIIERQLERLFNLAIRSPEAAQFGEMPHMLKELVDVKAFKKAFGTMEPWAQAAKAAKALASTPVLPWIPQARRQDWEDFTAFLRVLSPALGRAAQDAYRSFRDEMPYLERELGVAASSKLDIEELGAPSLAPRAAIGGKKGPLIRTPIRTLLAADQLQKSFVIQLEVVAQAYRMAKANGFRGKPLAQEMQRLKDDVGGEAWKRAYARVQELTFQQRGETLKSILRMRQGPMRWIFPFVATPWNIFALGLRKSPLGAASMLYETLWKAPRGDTTWRELHGKVPKFLAEQTVAYGALLAFMWNNNPDDPWITGAEGEFPGSARAGVEGRYGRSRPSQSVRIGGQWHSYARVEPFATVASLLVDVTNAWKRGERLELTAAAAKSLLAQTKEKTFLRGMSDVMQVFDTTSRERAFAWPRSFVTSWLPNIIRTGARTGQAERPLRDVYGEPRWPSRGKRLLQGFELGAFDDYPDYDLWGRPYPRSKDPFFGTDWLYRFVSPIYNRPAVPAFPGDILILNWNSRTPEGRRRYHPRPPERAWTLKDELFPKTRYLDDPQYSVFVRYSGRLGALRVAQTLTPHANYEQRTGSRVFDLDSLNIFTPSIMDRERLETLMKQGRDVARTHLKTQFWRNDKTGAEFVRERLQQIDDEIMWRLEGTYAEPWSMPTGVEQNRQPQAQRGP